MAEGVCSNNDPDGENCTLTLAEFGEYDAIACTRAILSGLSLIGTSSIILLALGKKQAFKSKVHPIFVLSVADFFLALLWIIGSVFWLTRVSDRRWCLVVSLLTVIMQCITINLTLVYAILAYKGLRRSSFSSAQPLMQVGQGDLELERVWKKHFTLGVYFVAWMLPVVLLLAMFGIVVGSSMEIISQIQPCSCFCLPVYGNVLPYAKRTDTLDQPTVKFLHNVSKILVSYGCVLAFHYFVVFTLLVIIYHKLLQHIKNLRHEHEREYRGGVAATTTAIINGQSKAKIRVYLFLLVFIINGLINFLLSVGITIYHAIEITPHEFINHRVQRPAFHNLFIITVLLQAFTVSLQGFSNAIVYGWTREDFVQTLALVEKKHSPKKKDTHIIHEMANNDDLREEAPIRPFQPVGENLLSSSEYETDVDMTDVELNN